MRLVRPSATIEMVTPNALQIIELAGRTCYKSEDKITGDSCKEFVKMILSRGHESVLEHASASVRFICDRGVSHEIVRHRIASFSQESTRYCDYEDGHVTFVVPPWCDIEEGVYKLMDDTTAVGADFVWFAQMQRNEEAYKSLRSKGWRPEQARSVLTNSLKTEVVMTANFREWCHFFKLRTANAAHPQMREVAIPLLNTFRMMVPIIFDEV